jgi:hypothetical protein
VRVSIYWGWLPCRHTHQPFIAAGFSSFQGTTHHQGLDLARLSEKAKPTGRKLRAKDRPLANDSVSDEAFDQMLHAWFGNLARVLLPGRAFYIWGGYANCANYPPVLKACELYFSQAILWVKDHPVLTRKDPTGSDERFTAGGQRPPGTRAIVTHCVALSYHLPVRLPGFHSPHLGPLHRQRDPFHDSPPPIGVVGRSNPSGGIGGAGRLAPVPRADSDGHRGSVRFAHAVERQRKHRVEDQPAGRRGQQPHRRQGPDLSHLLPRLQRPA